MAAIRQIRSVHCAHRLKPALLETERHETRKRQQAQAMQDAQAAWAQTRNELRANVVELQRLLAGAESRMVGSELDDAVRAASEVQVYRLRLEAAE